MKTILKSYRLFTDNESDRLAYESIVAKMRADNVKCFRALGADKDAYYYNFAADGAEVELETKHIFNNQWNTGAIPGVSESGLRVFDWAEYAAESAGLSRYFKSGHYLEITPEMREARARRGVCGYCGTQYITPYACFCTACIGNEYLDADTIKRGGTRIYPVADDRKWRAITPEEEATLLPAWREAQTHGNTARDKKRIADLRTRLERDYVKANRIAETEYKGFLWLLDNDINTKNFIFYGHTETFALGWQKVIDPDFRDEWRGLLADFPYVWAFSEARK